MADSTNLTLLERLTSDALALPAPARAELAHRLLSLDESRDDAESSALRVALRRSDELARGVVHPIPVAEAVDRLRAGLRR